ncbi:MAG TPA: 50S ribosomal protein L9 [Candidatus Limnocylindrales bacterium]|nr:50S ribosomal protein L9 [Candidatus Limnocylindrales bacterium]
MKVVLLEDVKGTGKSGETKDVADGFARNFLIPRKLATAATAGAVERMEREKATLERREQRELEGARELGKRLESAQVTITLRAGKDGKLFGTVTNADVASALKQQHGIVVDRRKIEFAEPVRALGPAVALVKVHQQVSARVPLVVTSG